MPAIVAEEGVEETPVAPTEVVVVEATVLQPTETALPPTATATLESTVEPTAEEAEPTLPPIRATQQALLGMVTVSPREGSAERIADDDYVGLLMRACQIVQENYVRDTFNGLDWPAVCQRYRERAEAIDNQEAFWNLMDEFIAELGDDHSRFVRPDSFAAEFRLPREGSGRPWPGMELWANEEQGRVLVYRRSAAGHRRGADRPSRAVPRTVRG